MIEVKGIEHPEREEITYVDLMYKVKEKGSPVTFIGSLKHADYSGLFLATYEVLILLNGGVSTWMGVGRNDFEIIVDKYVDLEINVKDVK